MDPLDVTHGVLRRWMAEVRGNIDPQINIGAGPPACPRHQACQCHSHSGVLSARLVPCVCRTLPPREGGLHVGLTDCIFIHAMATQLPLS